MLLSRPSKGPDFVEPEVELPPDDDDDSVVVKSSSINNDEVGSYSELPRSLNGPRNLTDIIV
jgi:hypothetical protein